MLAFFSADTGILLPVSTAKLETPMIVIVATNIGIFVYNLCFGPRPSRWTAAVLKVSVRKWVKKTPVLAENARNVFSEAWANKKKKQLPKCQY